ncbi:unnamed protein product, partial [marine sediment metagenome]
MAFFAFLIKQRRENNYRHRNNYNIDDVVTHHIIKTHKGLRENRQLTTELVKYDAETGDDKGHYEYNYQHDKYGHKNRI